MTLDSRMWDDSLQEMAYTDGTLLSLNSLITVAIKGEAINEKFVFMDYTGEVDKNKNKIYKGDYLAGVDSVVTFHKGSFCVKHKYNKEYKSLMLVRLEECEVIGNIYENKELLNG